MNLGKYISISELQPIDILRPETISFLQTISKK